jgi:type IV pilus assembly protein PilB
VDSTQFLIRALVADRLISDADAARAKERAAKSDGDILAALVEMGAITSRKLAINRAKLCEYPYVDLANYDIAIKNSNLIPRTIAEKFGVFPLFIVEGLATVGMIDPLNLHAIDQARQCLKIEVDPVLCEPVQLRALIARAYNLGRTHEKNETVDPATLTTGQEPVVAAANQILTGAIDAGASDVHISPDEKDLILRYRVDGVLHRQQGPAKSMHAALAQRLKVLAGLDLTQTRKPQDGKFRFGDSLNAVDVRLSTTPTIHGENVVMRLLRPGRAIGSLADLNMPRDIELAYQACIHSPHGMILVTGPTGSGKTTTLYTALNVLNDPSRNIMTIEDPVEIRLPLVRQIQVNHDIGLTFASALRSMLRQDPDVMLVGEIRDEETARIAFQAALTGHLVFSTLHTNDAIGTLARLTDLAVPTFAINGALLASIAQRLVRRVCTECAAPDAANPALLAAFSITADERAKLKRGPGCRVCLNSGYRGRVGVFEFLRFTNVMRALVERRAPHEQIRVAAIAEGFRDMLSDGLAKAIAGITTLDEVSRLRAAEECDTPRSRAAA